jgi:hypothetical protein
MGLDRTLPGESALGQFRSAEDHHENIVEVVGDAPGQGPQRLYLLGLSQLLFQAPVRGEVVKDDHDAMQRLVRAPNRGTTVVFRDTFFTLGCTAPCYDAN